MPQMRPVEAAVESRWVRYRDEFMRRTRGHSRQLRKRDFLAGFEAGWDYAILVREITKRLEELVDFMENASPDQIREFKALNRDEIEILRHWLREGQK